MQYAYAILSSVTVTALQYFSTLSHKRRDFRKQVTEHKMCVLVFSTTFVWNISHSEKKWARYDQKIYIGLHVQYRLLLSHCNGTGIFYTYFRKNHKHQISWKSVRWKPSCFMRKDRHDEADSRFSHSANASKKNWTNEYTIQGLENWATGPNQTPILWPPGVLCPGLRLPKSEATYSSPSNEEAG